MRIRLLLTSFSAREFSKFVETYYKDILGATDYWLRFEWQHCGSPHVHKLAWLPNARREAAVMRRLIPTHGYYG